MLQASHRNPAIRHGVLSLVSYYDTLSSPSDAHENAIQAKRHYVDALSTATGPLALQHATSTDEVLILSLLLHCIEIFRQQYNDAFVHLQAALRIVHGMSSGEISHSRVATIVDRLKKWPNKIDAVSLARGACLPLTSIDSARERLMQIHSWISRRLYAAPSGYEDVRDLCRGFQLQLYDWNADFDQLCSRQEFRVGNEARSAIYVRILHGLIALAVSIVSAEQNRNSSFPPGRYDARIGKLLAYCRAFTDIGSHGSHLQTEKEPPPFRPIIFGFDTEFILIVLFLSHMTKDLALRQEAVNLLRSAHRQEGSWDSFQAAHIIECLERVSDQDNVIISSVAYFHDISYSTTSRQALEFSRPDTVCVEYNNRDLTASTTWFRCTCNVYALCSSTSVAKNNIKTQIKMEESTTDLTPVYEQTEFTPSVVTQILVASRYRVGVMPTHMGSSVLAVRQQKLV